MDFGGCHCGSVHATVIVGFFLTWHTLVVMQPGIVDHDDLAAERLRNYR
jgi:hypothetical protein